MADLIGSMIRDYKVTAYVGKGGHGAVYRGEDVSTGKNVAIKVLLPEHSADAELAQRIQQESEIFRDLKHPHIVSLLDTWKDERGIWMVMPWIPGGDLRDYLKQHGRMQPEMLSPILHQICSALEAAHAIQIIHRDIKPDNILLDEDGLAYLSDFGIAKRTNHGAITSVGTVIGSPNYLSPEQIMGGEISNRSDIYALGVTIYEMLSGEHPYAGIVSRLQLMMKVVQDNFPPLTESEIAEKYVDKINALIWRCTAKNPDERYPSAMAVATDFKQILSTN